MDRSRASFDSDDDTAAGSGIETPFLEKQTFAPSRRTFGSRLLRASHLITASFDSASLKSISRSTGFALLPSFITHRSPSNKADCNSIAALDGLRGLACLIVFNEHLSYNFTSTFLFGYGVDNRRTIVQWPFVRVLWSGFSMVSTFYVISGYVLCYKPLRQIKANDLHSFHKNLTSSVFRRAMRLYLPSIIAVMICGLLLSLGAFGRASSIFNKDDNYLHLHESPPPIFDTFLAQTYDTAKCALQMLNVWDWTDDLSANDYDRHLWTIVVEFRSSMVLFLLLLGTSRLRQTCRLLICICFTIFCILTARKDVLLFVSGMLVAELDLIRKSTEPSLLPSTIHRRLPRRLLSSLTWPFTFLLGLYLCSVPVIGCESTTGFVTLTSLVPSCFPDRSAFIRSVGAILTTWSAANSESLKPIFTNRFSLYLGKISFALYLVHGNVLKSLLYSVMPIIYGITNDGTSEGISLSGLVQSWMLGALVVLPVTFWLSDVFWRGVDMPCVRFARWVESKVSVDEVELGRR
jgi:peptidoglycan/LPS O-acetylase OafA/YrhL